VFLFVHPAFSPESLQGVSDGLITSMNIFQAGRNFFISFIKAPRIKIQNLNPNL